MHGLNFLFSFFGKEVTENSREKNMTLNEALVGEFWLRFLFYRRIERL
jgi:hypothetical protein